MVPGQETRAAGWGPPPPYSRGSTSELGSISASTPMGSLSPAHRSPISPKNHLGAGSSPTTSTPSAAGSKEGSLRKDHRSFSGHLPPRQNKPAVHPSPVGRMNIDPRRMPWSPQTANIHPAISNGLVGGPLTPARNITTTHQTGSPSGRRKNHYISCK